MRQPVRIGPSRSTPTNREAGPHHLKTARPYRPQQLQFLQVQGLQRQPPWLVVQPHAGFFSLVFSIAFLLFPATLIRRR